MTVSGQKVKMRSMMRRLCLEESVGMGFQKDLLVLNPEKGEFN